MKLVRRGILAAGAISLLALSCQVLLGIEDPDLIVDERDGAPTPLEEAAVDAGPVLCRVGVQPPPPPGTSDGTTHRFTFALRRIALGGSDASVGFDLDRACTCNLEAPEEARRPTCRLADADVPCDLDGGVDNALGKLARDFGDRALDPFHRGVEKEYACGRQTLILILQNYNGGPDDDDVLVFPTASFGIDEQDDGGIDCAPTFRARWDGTDVWSVRNDEITIEGVPIRSSLRGYVTKNRLVVDGRSQNGMIPLAGIGIQSVRIEQAVLMATLTPMDGGMGLTDGVIAGRAKLEPALISLGNVKVEDAGDLLSCESDVWPAVRVALCGATDMVADPGQDFSDLRCDAISFVTAFEAAPAQVRTRQAPPEKKNACDAALLECP